MSRMYNPCHPGKILHEWLEGFTVTESAEKLGVTRATLSRILNGHTGISADMAIRLSQALGTTPEFWLGMQSQYDLWQAMQKPSPQVVRFVHQIA